MQRLEKILLIFFLIPLSIDIKAQENPEQAIRRLEKMEKEAILKGDTVALFKELWSPNLIVNNPANIVVTRPQIAALIKAGKIDYSEFERIIEKISIVGNTAIVMGREEIKPQGVTGHAGQLVTRRFTNIWVKEKGTWKLIGRQATISSVM